jgi:ATP-dependent Clp protease ATP-binding subunit ClpA
VNAHSVIGRLRTACFGEAKGKEVDFLNAVHIMTVNARA